MKKRVGKNPIFLFIEIYCSRIQPILITNNDLIIRNDHAHRYTES